MQKHLQNEGSFFVCEKYTFSKLYLLKGEQIFLIHAKSIILIKGPLLTKLFVLNKYLL